MEPSTGTASRQLEPLHVNWTGWKYLGDLLELLGCDLSEMDGSNDGKFVNESTALDWGEEIQAALTKGQLRERHTPAPRHEGGFYPEPTLDPGDHELDTESKEWLLRVAEFFRASEGFRQF